MVKELELDTDAILKDIGKQMTATAKRASPVDTGAMRRGWSFTIKGQSVALQNTEDYAEFYPEITDKALASVDLKQAVEKHLFED